MAESKMSYCYAIWMTKLQFSSVFQNTLIWNFKYVGCTFSGEIFQYLSLGRYASIYIPQCNAVIMTTTALQTMAYSNQGSSSVRPVTLYRCYTSSCVSKVSLCKVYYFFQIGLLLAWDTMVIILQPARWLSCSAIINEKCT